MKRRYGRSALRILGLTGIALGLFISLALAQPPSGEVIRIMAGNSQMYGVDFAIEKVAIGDPKIFGAVQTGPNEMLINALAEGASNLIIFGPANQRKELLINVITADLMLRAQELRGLLSDIEGIEVKIVGKQIVVDGQVFKSKDFGKISQLLASMDGVVNLVAMSPRMKTILAEQMAQAIDRPNIAVHVGKNAFLLEGVVPNDEESQRAEKIAQAYAPAIVNALVSAKSQEKPKPYARPDIIEVNMTIMEVNKNALREFGIFWNPSITSTANGNFDHQSNFTWFPGHSTMTETLAYSLAGIITNFFPTMRRIYETGEGRALMQQTLVTRDGGKAEFFAGSEEPVPVAQGNGVITTEYKKVGMTLNISPSIDPQGNIETMMDMESSTVAGQGTNGAPVIDKNTMATAVNVKRGVTIVLGGLAGQRELKALANRNPNSAQPTLFQANYDKQRSADSTEIVVFITPRVVEDVQTASREVEMKTRDSFKRVELDNLRKQYQEQYK